MATPFHLPVTAAQVGTYFVGQYYQLLQQQPDFVHQFYNEASTMLRIDGNSRETATTLLVDSVNKHGILLEVVQVLTDLNLVIMKAYISSDGGWFMDVFNAVDQDGNKIRDEGVFNYIQKKLSWFCYPISALPKHSSQKL